MPRRLRLVAMCERHSHALAGLMLLELGLLADTGVGGLLVLGGSILVLLLGLEWSRVVRTAHRAPPGVIAHYRPYAFCTDLADLRPTTTEASRSCRSMRIALLADRCHHQG